MNDIRGTPTMEFEVNVLRRYDWWSRLLFRLFEKTRWKVEITSLNYDTFIKYHPFSKAYPNFEPYANARGWFGYVRDYTIHHLKACLPPGYHIVDVSPTTERWYSEADYSHHTTPNYDKIELKVYDSKIPFLRACQLHLTVYNVSWMEWLYKPDEYKYGDNCRGEVILYNPTLNNPLQEMSQKLQEEMEMPFDVTQRY